MYKNHNYGVDIRYMNSEKYTQGFLPAYLTPAAESSDNPSNQVSVICEGYQDYGGLFESAQAPRSATLSDAKLNIVSIDVREFLIRLVAARDTAVARPRAAKGYAQGLLKDVFLSAMQPSECSAELDG
ncbi:hypothetical protein B0H11DRAFT_1934736 [Mycena galericulata]|nr:hypothetical protein B0H11DRAFT_1934736 [Mycena galericulata]